MNRLVLLLVPVIAAIVVPKQEVCAQEGEEGILESFPVNSDTLLKYQLMIGPCEETYCKTRLLVVGPEGPVDTLEWEHGLLADSEPYKHRDCWRTDTSDLFAVLCSRLVRLGLDWNGVLLSYAVGVDLPGVDHDLVALVDDTLARLGTWEASMGGVFFNQIRVEDADGDSVDELANIKGYGAPGMPDVIDKWSVSTFGWNAERGAVIDISDTPRGFPAYATIIGSYETLAEARARQDSLAPCLPYGFQVLESNGFPMLRPGWFILAQLTIDREEAFQTLEAVNECIAPEAGYVRRAQ